MHSSGGESRIDAMPPTQMLCPQPNGRFTTIEVGGGDQRIVAGPANTIVTFAR